jgi:putative Mg2+ transporter-C (MgtC) family protein
MPSEIHWSEIALRLLCAVVAGALIGLNRSEHGHAAGLRTSGMGFIGAGAVVRRDNLVAGVTTAATLWLLTVLGLCFGGGQVALGLVGAALGVLVLTGFKLLESRMTQDRQGTLVIVTAASGPDGADLRTILQNDGLRIAACGFAATRATANHELTCELRWRAKPGDSNVPQSICRLMSREDIFRIAWNPRAR